MKKKKDYLNKYSEYIFWIVPIFEFIFRITFERFHLFIRIQTSSTDKVFLTKPIAFITIVGHWLYYVLRI